MAEVRKHQPDAGDGIGRLVREALGESIRPTHQGRSSDRHGDEDDPSPHQAESDAPSASSLPDWPSDGPAFTF